MGLRYAQPDNEEAFEECCLRYYRRIWNNGSLTLYGKRGEKQDGVDIHDPRCLKPVRAVQCKHREATKILSPDEIRQEVRKAEQSSLPIEVYVIATTARKSKAAQDTVVELNSRTDADKKFTVELDFWDDICKRLSELTRVQAEFVVAGQDIGQDLLASILQDPHIASMAARFLPEGAELRAGEFSDIEMLLESRCQSFPRQTHFGASLATTSIRSCA
jgi:hypothetical protein